MSLRFEAYVRAACEGCISRAPEARPRTAFTGPSYDMERRAEAVDAILRGVAEHLRTTIGDLGNAARQDRLYS